MPGSPPWHRRCRKRRSTARSRVHRRRAAGLPPARRDLRLLAEHHSCPAPREFMGPKGYNKWESWHGSKPKGRDQGTGGGAWSYWSGSWKTRTPDRQSSQHTEMAFPAYAAMDVSTTASGSGASLALAQSQTAPGQDPAQQMDGDYLKSIQKNLNNNRRVEGRIRKLQEEQIKKQTQWKMFESYMKELFIKEQKQYQADLEANAKELMDLEEQKTQALRSLLHTIENRQEPGMTAPADRPMEADPWAAFLRDAQVPMDQERWAADQDLAQALLAAQDPARFADYIRARVDGQPSALSALSTLNPATPCVRPSAPPRTPLRPQAKTDPTRPSGHTGFQPVIGTAELAASGYVMSPAQAPIQSDPYQVSPSVSVLTGDINRQAATTPFGTPFSICKAAAPKPRCAFGKPGDRLPVKVATKQLTSPPVDKGSSSLQEKVEARRAALSAAANLPTQVILDDDYDSQETGGLPAQMSSELDPLGELS